MPDKAAYKHRGGKKDSATKHAINRPNDSGNEPPVEGKSSNEQDPKRRIGQFGDAGEPPLMKR